MLPTGSGKSLAYIIPVVDHVLRSGSGRGTQAIIIYPMNALANSQEKELEKFLQHGVPAGPPPVGERAHAIVAPARKGQAQFGHGYTVSGSLSSHESGSRRPQTVMPVQARTWAHARAMWNQHAYLLGRLEDGGSLGNGHLTPFDRQGDHLRLRGSRHATASITETYVRP